MIETSQSQEAQSPADTSFRSLESCRVCANTDLFKYLDLGSLPLVNSYVAKEAAHQPDPTFPLEINFCSTCAMSQLSVVVDPSIMFRNYFYRSSISKTFMDHCYTYAQTMAERFAFGPDDLVVDIASNDGACLSMFKKCNMKVLGVDPAINLAKIAEDKGIPTHPDFWSPKVATKLKEEQGGASFITASNVFAHVDDLDSFLTGINTMLKDDGIFCIEVPYAVPFFENTEFDTTYHEHLSYFLLKPILHLYHRHQLEVFDVESFAIHGGTIRVYAKKQANSNLEICKDHIQSYLDKEAALGLHEQKTYTEYANKVLKIKEDMLTLMAKLKSEGKSIAAYGASAKGNILTNYCQLDKNTISYIVDDTPEKQGTLSPGNHIPIVSAEELTNNPPDYLILTAWNFAKELMAKTHAFQEAGGRYIVPIPVVSVV